MRKILPVFLCIAILLYLVLLSHHSTHDAILGRYSLKYFCILLLYPLGVGMAWIIINGYGKPLANYAAQSLGAIFNTRFMTCHYRMLLGLILLFHVLLVCRLLPPGLVFSNEPILRVDYAHHFHQVSVVVQTLAKEGKFWVYDPSFCAGYPEGTIFDVDMKLIEVITYALAKAGLGLGCAFNIAIFAFLLLPPFLLLLACHNFRLSRGQTLLGIAVSILLWHALPSIVIFNAAGMCAFVFGTYWAILSLSIFHRFLEHPSGFYGLGLFLTLAIAFSIHILSVFLLLGPMLVMYARALSPLSLRRALPPILIAVAAAAANAWWLVTVFHFMPYRVNTSYFAPPSLSELILSMIQLDDYNFVLALIGIWGFYSIRFRQGRHIAVMGISAILYYNALAYLTSNIILLRNLEMTRFMMPGAVISLLGFALGLSNAFRSYWELRHRAVHFFPMLLLFGVFVIKLLLPQTFIKPIFTQEKKDLQPLIDWIKGNTDLSSRIAFMDLSPGRMTGAKMQSYTGRFLIGGPFEQLNLVHSYASFSSNRFFDKRLSELEADHIREYARLYNIHWIITTSDGGYNAFSRFPGELKLIKQMVLYWGGHASEVASDSPFTKYSRPGNEYPIGIFEVNNQPSYFIAGSGTLNASLNRIEIKNAAPGKTVINFHWLPTLAVDPPLPIKKYEVKGNPLGFIQVDNGAVRNFTIFNSYRWPARPAR